MEHRDGQDRDDVPRSDPAASDRWSRLEDLPLRTDLRGRAPYGAPQLDVAVRLNTNENSFPLPPGLLADIAAAVQAVAADLNRYPDREAVELRADLAAYLGHGLSPEQVWAANGSNEVLAQLAQAFGGPGRSAVGFSPSYSMHELIATGAGTTWIDAGRAADFTLTPGHAADQVRRHDPDLVLLCSPNNPTGTALGLDVVEAVLDVARGMVIVDEAYHEFARPGTPSALTLLPGNPRLVVTRTMSKAFGMAGLRLGYLAADAAVVDALGLVRLPYHLSTLTQVTARAALAHTAELLSTVAAVKMQRDRIAAAAAELGLPTVDSDANFVLVGGFADERGAWRALLDRGVLVREIGIPAHLRVTAGTPEETSAFLDALAEIVALPGMVVSSNTAPVADTANPPDDRAGHHRGPARRRAERAASR